jgi:acetate kinase
MSDSVILVINTGSSSLKLGLYVQKGDDEKAVLVGSADSVGTPDARIEITKPGGEVVHQAKISGADQQRALTELTSWMHKHGEPVPSAVGHRVVHGGPHLTDHQLITDDLVASLRGAVHFAPLHIPAALELIEVSRSLYPGVAQFACFDTAFHRTLPDEAARLPLPNELFEEGVRRYGFHGLSYESILHQLGADLPPRVVIAHLGSGASLAAVKDGKSADTSMGLTPTGGIPMATRTGDLDPGVLLYLLRAKKLDADSLESLLNHDAGLKAVSDGEADMRKLEENREQTATEAIEIFCRAIAKTVAAYASVLGGLDLLVFTGGIGEHSSRVRGQVCRKLEFLGLAMDEQANAKQAAFLSDTQSRIAVKMLTSEEDLQIARHCRRLMQTA